MDGIIDGLLAMLGLEGSALIGALALISVVARFIGKAIPDSTTGILGIVRKVSKVIGLYVSNRIDANTEEADVVKSVLPTR